MITAAAARAAILAGLLLAAALPAVAETGRQVHDDYRQPVCAIIGRVNQVQSVEKAPWNDGTPSTLTVTEIRISLAIETRRPLRAGADDPEDTIPADGSDLYKLCSPRPVKAVDRILGVEGLATGTDSQLGCLFDVAVLPAAPTP